MDERPIATQLQQAVEAELGDVPVEIELRREIEGVADASIVLRSRESLPAEARSRLAEALGRCEIVETARVGDRRASVRFRRDYLDARLEWLLASHPRPKLGFSRKGERWLVDFLDPNLTKPLHLGHLRSIALGWTTARLLAFAGADTTTQCVACDIGRNVVEALAGCTKDGVFDQRPIAKGDHVVGHCYAAYVGDESGQTSQYAADAPLARELVTRGDLADQLLDLWRSNDTQVLERWQRMIGWVRDGQQSTLTRLGVTIDRTVLESHGAAVTERLLDDLRRKGCAIDLEDGATAHDTGLSSYSRMLLTRSDGFPTEHLRALGVWEEIAPELARLSGVVHVMGDEWTASTDVRLALLKRLAPWPWPPYHCMAHGMVTFGGSRLKSSEGATALLDDHLDALEARFCGGDWANYELAACSALGDMLATAAVESFEHPGPGTGVAGGEIADFLCGQRPGAHAGSPEAARRFSVLQWERLGRALGRGAETLDPTLPFRFLLRVVRSASGRLGDDAAHECLRNIVAQGASALGLIRSRTAA